MPKASLLVAMTVSVLCGCPHVLSHLSVHTFACVPHCVARMHPALCGPACKPAASDVARVGARACACARVACSRGLCPFRPAAAGRGLCPPRRPASLQPFPPVSPERGTAFTSPPPAIRLSSSRRYARLVAGTPPKTRDPAHAGATVGRCLPLCAQCGASGRSTGAAL
jgi:hypothetical protein